MNTCDPGIVELILGFSVGGIGLRYLIGLVKDQLKVKGIWALLITLACCAGAVLVYMGVTSWVWECFLFWTCLVFTGTQAAYRLTHKGGIKDERLR